METQPNDRLSDVLNQKFWLVLLAGGLLVFLCGAIIDATVNGLTGGLSFVPATIVTIFMTGSLLALNAHSPKLPNPGLIAGVIIAMMLVLSFGTQHGDFIGQLGGAWLWLAVTVVGTTIYVWQTSLIMLSKQVN